MEILQLVDQLEQTLNRGWRVPLSPSLIVNSEECLRLIDQMRISIPSAIKESERMITERDRILSDAQARAEQIIAHAEQQAIQIVGEDSITERAREEAERIIAHGHAEAIRLVDEAEVYALDVLYRLRDNLHNSLQQAENGIQAIEASQAPQEQIEPEEADHEYAPSPAFQPDDDETLQDET
jgi:flagellar biosynthesis/type III secretory pathway protein FliH